MYYLTGPCGHAKYNSEGYTEGIVAHARWCQIGGCVCSIMATAKCLVSLDTFRSKYYSDSAHGTRTYFILGSVAGSSHDGDVVPRRALNLTDEDRRILSNLGLPPERWTDLEVLLARIKQAEGTDIAGQAISTPDNELSCEYVLVRLREFFQNSTDKDGGKYTT